MTRSNFSGHDNSLATKIANTKMSKLTSHKKENIENSIQSSDETVLTTVKSDSSVVAQAIAATADPVVNARIIHPKAIVETDKNAAALDPNVAAEMLAKDTALLSVPLTDEERTDLEQLSDSVRQGLDCARFANLALREIRDRQLWRETDDSFETYCRREFDMSEQRVSQLLQCAEEIALLEGRVAEDLIPKTERAVRALRRVKNANKVLVLTLAAKLSRNGTPDSTSIEQAREQVEGKKPEKTRRDGGMKADVALKAAQQLKDFLEKGDVKKMTGEQLDDLKAVIGEIAADSKKLNLAA